MTARARGPGRPPMSSEGGPAAKLSVKVPHETRARLEALAETLGRTPADLLREGIERVLRRPPKPR